MGPEPELSRRRLLTTAGALSSGALAGCGGNLNDDSGDAQPNNSSETIQYRDTKPVSSFSYSRPDAGLGIKHLGGDSFAADLASIRIDDTVAYQSGNRVNGFARDDLVNQWTGLIQKGKKVELDLGERTGSVSFTINWTRDDVHTLDADEFNVS